MSVRRLVAGGLCVLFVSACGLSRPAVEIHSYLIAPQWPQTQQAEKPLRLRVQPFDVATQFEGKPLVYRFNDVRYEADFYNEFLVPPRVMLMEQSVEWLRRAGHHATADGTGNAYVLHAAVPAMYGDFRERERPLAVLATRFTVTEPGVDQPALQREYTVTVPIEDRSAQSVARGLSTALTQTLTQLHVDLQALSKRADH